MQQSCYQTPCLTVSKSQGRVLGWNDFYKPIQTQSLEEDTMLISPVAQVWAVLSCYCWHWRYALWWILDHLLHTQERQSTPEEWEASSPGTGRCHKLTMPLGARGVSTVLLWSNYPMTFLVWEPRFMSYHTWISQLIIKLIHVSSNYSCLLHECRLQMSNCPNFNFSARRTQALK